MLNRKKIMTSLFKMSKDSAAANIHPGIKVSTPLREASLPGSDFYEYGPEEIKPAKILGESMMMITYCWELESVEREYKTISSRMISFQGQKVFRLGLKNRDKPTLIFLGINLNTIGLRIREVGFCTKDLHCRQKMTHNNVDGHSLQLFTFDLNAMVVGNCTFTFSIWLEGGAPVCYSYQLSDRLSKQELWNATSNNQHLVDVEFVCKDNKKFSAHKAILAARSPVFLTKFKNEPLQPKNAPLKQITIDDVDSSTVEQFIYFLYTGEIKIPMLDNEDLLKLAFRYQLTTLIELCQIGVHEIDVMQMASFVSNLELDQTELPSTVSISPNRDTHVTYNKLESTLRVIWIFEGRKSAEKPLAIDYQNENLFSLHLKERMVHFICVNNRKFVDKVLYSTNYTNWFKMNPKNTKQKWEKSEMLFFVAKADINFEKLCEQSIVFDIKMLSTIPNYCYEMADKSWGIQLWEAAYLQTWFTDVTIFIGPKKIMEAHQVILSARSPEMCTLLDNLKQEGKATIVFPKIYDQLVVENFLYFLYTGSSKLTFKNKQLLQLAVDYKVETLTKVCQLAIIDPPDVDEVTNFLLANF